MHEWKTGVSCDSILPGALTSLDMLVVGFRRTYLKDCICWELNSTLQYLICNRIDKLDETEMLNNQYCLTIVGEDRHIINALS